MTQASLFDPPVHLSHTQQSVHEALRWLVVASDTTDIRRALAEHDIPMERNCIAKRLNELEELGLVERVGRNYSRRGNPTTWKRRG